MDPTTDPFVDWLTEAYPDIHRDRLQPMVAGAMYLAKQAWEAGRTYERQLTRHDATTTSFG